jgi:hypothetical protein
MAFKKIETEKAPKAIGPYSQAVGFESLLFVSGQNYNEMQLLQILQQFKKRGAKDYPGFRVFQYGKYQKEQVNQLSPVEEHFLKAVEEIEKREQKP